jgi:uncharacterized protein (DUF305 family)
VIPCRRSTCVASDLEFPANNPYQTFTKSRLGTELVTMYTGLIACVLGHALLVVAAGSRELFQAAPVPAAAPPQAAIQLNALMLATDEAMLADPPCSNTDRMYAQMMIPHEQGAVQMAQWELKNGSNAELLNISRSITTSSPQWVAQLQQALTRLPTPADCAAPAPAPADASPSPAADAPSPPLSGAESDLVSTVDTMLAPTAALDSNPDRDWALLMIKHHQAAIDMAKAEKQYGADRALLTLAAEVTVVKSAQLKMFKSILADDFGTQSSK